MDKKYVVEAKKLKFIYSCSLTIISLLACFILDLFKASSSGYSFLFFIFSI